MIQNSFYEELAQVFFYNFSKYRMKIMFLMQNSEKEYFQTDNWE